MSQNGWTSVHTYLAVQANPLQPIVAEWAKKWLWFLLPKAKNSQETIDSKSIEDTINQAIEDNLATSIETKLTEHLEAMNDTLEPVQATLESIMNRLERLEEEVCISKSIQQQQINTIGDVVDEVAGVIGSINRQLQRDTTLTSITRELQSIDKRLKDVLPMENPRVQRIIRHIETELQQREISSRQPSAALNPFNL